MTSGAEVEKSPASWWTRYVVVSDRGRHGGILMLELGLSRVLRCATADVVAAVPRARRKRAVRLRLVLGVLVVAAACGGDAPEPGAGELTLVSSWGSWIGSSWEQSEFDVTEQVENTRLLGAKAVWVFETYESNPDVVPDLKGVASIEGDRVSGFVRLDRMPGGYSAAQYRFETEEYDGGFTIEFEVGALLRPSALAFTSEDQDRRRAAIAAGQEAGIQLDFVEDRDSDGVLEYVVGLSGTIEVGGVEVEVNDFVRFTVIESDPFAVPEE